MSFDQICNQMAQDLRQIAVLARQCIAEHPAFRNKPVGAPGSDARIEQERAIALEDSLLKLAQSADKTLFDWDRSHG